MADTQLMLCGNRGCVGILPVSMRGEFLLATPTFPSALVQCGLHLLGNPTVVYCPVCQHSNDVLDAVLLLNEIDGKCVLYFAERHRSNPKLIEDVRNGLVNELGLRDCVLASDPRGFRRAVATTVIHDYMRTLNEGTAADNLLTWLQEDKKRVGLPFMSAMWLVLMGALPVGADPVDPREAVERVKNTKSFFQPTTGDSPLFSDLQKSRAKEHIADFVAEILCLRLLQISIGLGKPPVLANALEELRDICPRVLLRTDVSSRLGRSLADMMALVSNQEDSIAALVGGYTLEALHAMLHHLHGTANPRKAEWTRQLARFEAAQPSDSKRAGMLLSEDILHDTLDEGLFIQTISSLTHSIGAFEPEDQGFIACLIRPVADLYPSQVVKLFGYRVSLRDGTKNKLSDVFERKFFDKIFVDNNGDRVAVTLINALRNASRYPDEMPKICSAAWSARLAAPCDLNQRLSCLNKIIEHLNLVRNHQEAMQYARIGDAALAKDSAGAGQAVLASFRNEYGNCYRYLGQFDRAPEQYEISLDNTSKSPKVPDVRVVLRNIAIVQRSLGQFSAAREKLFELRKDAEYLERFGLLLSEAICLQLAGHWDRALNLLESHAGEIQPAAYVDQNVRFYTFSLGQLLYYEDRFEAAIPYLEASLAAARDVNDTYFVALLDCLLYRCKSALSGLPDENRRKQIIDELFALLDGPLPFEATTSATFGVAHHASELLMEDGQYDRAEEVTRKSLALRGEEAHDVWTIHVMAAELADARGDREQATTDLIAALSNLTTSIRGADPQNDPFALLSRRYRSIVRLASLLVKYCKVGLFKPEVLWLCADIQTSPVLTSRLTEGIIPLAAYTMDAVKKFLGTDTAMLQFIEGDDGIMMQLTTVVGGEPHLTTESLGLRSKEARRLDARLDYWLRRQRVSDKTLSPGNVRGWESFRSRILEFTGRVPAETALLVAPGPLSTSAVHLAIPHKPHCFVPSMGAAMAIRTRRSSEGTFWRPQRMFNLSVWRAGDSEAVVEAMQEASLKFTAIGQKYGVTVEQAIGGEANATALIEGLKKSELARLACHGQATPLDQNVDLLLAADGQLPPSVVEAYLNDRYDKNHFGWRNVQNLSSVPRVVISSACDSGYSILNDGGEWLGFDRALLRAGVSCYIAPLWPVAVDEIQQLTCSIVEHYLAKPGATISEAVVSASSDLASRGGGQLTSQSIAVFGDFL